MVGATSGFWTSIPDFLKDSHSNVFEFKFKSFGFSNSVYFLCSTWWMGDKDYELLWEKMVVNVGLTLKHMHFCPEISPMFSDAFWQLLSLYILHIFCS